MKRLKERIQQIKKKRPAYGEMLDFYQKVKEAQDEVKTSLKIDPIKLKKEWKELLAKEGFSLIQKEDFPLDTEASAKLFQTLCQIGKDANPHMAAQVKKIEEALAGKRIDLKKLFKKGVNPVRNSSGTLAALSRRRSGLNPAGILLKRNPAAEQRGIISNGVKEQKIGQLADELELDKKVFSFLIESSARPSIEAGMGKLRNELDPETWLKGYCPMCGSLPSLGLLKEEIGKRYLICSYCGFQWRIDRLVCPFCNNRDQQSLHYLFAEGEESYRIDLCEKCHQYIKTIDLRNLEESDPYLEDLATLHLDILASQKGYKRPVPNPWTT